MTAEAIKTIEVILKRGSDVQIQRKGLVAGRSQRLLYLPPPSQELLFRRVGKQVRMAPFQCVIQEIQVLLSLLGHSVLHRSGTDWDCQAQSHCPS